jgi:hypothetical protein
MNAKRTVGVDGTAKERFLNKIEILPNGCWEWQARINASGYGTFTFNGSTQLAHRIAQHLFRNGIPDGLTVDHLCGNRECVNPLHHEIVTQTANNARSNSPSAVNARKNACKHGHPFSEENTYYWEGKRACRTCGRKATKAYGERIKARGR